ncbi:MAG TPA: hypothetical protein VD791_10155 [Burkholderiales bacterium]|nr:hypothetical protein [Burkholderiales bacterium]
MYLCAPGRHVAAMLALLPLLAACLMANQRYSTPHTEDFGLAAGQLESGGLGFLTPSTVTGQEEDRQPLALVVADVLAEQRKEIRTVGLPETLSAVNRAGLTEAYKRMYQDYRDSGVFEPKVLRQVGDAVGVRYMVQLKMAGFRQDSRERFGLLGLSILQTQAANIRLFLQIWDTDDGSIVWEGNNELNRAFDTFSERSVSFDTVVRESASELVAKLP